MNPPSLFYQQALQKASIPNANPFPTPKEVINLRLKAKVTTLPDNPKVAVFAPTPTAPLQNFPENDTATKLKPIVPVSNLTPPDLEPTVATSI
jgi:hypothetical protein